MSDAPIPPTQPTPPTGAIPPAPPAAATPAVRVFLVDHHLAFRSALTVVLEREADLRVVGRAGSLAEGRRVIGELAATEAPDVAIVEVALPDGEGVDLVGGCTPGSPGAS